MHPNKRPRQGVLALQERKLPRWCGVTLPEDVCFLLLKRLAVEVHDDPRPMACFLAAHGGRAIRILRESGLWASEDWRRDAAGRLLLRVALAMINAGLYSESVVTEEVARAYAGSVGFEERGIRWLGAQSKGAVNVEISHKGGSVSCYIGERGNERKVRTELIETGSVRNFEGEKGKERLVQCEFPDGKVHHFEGKKGQERLVRCEFSNGEVQYFEGIKGEERKVRTELTNGEVRYYKDEKGHERRVRTEFPNGEVGHYEGEKGQERLVRAEFSKTGNVGHFEGIKGEERKVRAEFWKTGNVQHFEGIKGEERKVRTEFPNGKVGHYEGKKGQERLVRIVHKGGVVQVL